MTPKEFIELYEKSQPDNICGSTLKVPKMDWLDKYMNNFPTKDYERNLAFDIYKYLVYMEDEFDITKAIEDLNCTHEDFMREFGKLMEYGYIKLDLKIKEQDNAN